MKKLFLIATFLCFSSISFAYHYSCSGLCKSGCITWTIHYNVDCNGLISSFEAVYWNGGQDFDYINSTTNPEFVGMEPTGLDGDCPTDFCP